MKLKILFVCLFVVVMFLVTFPGLAQSSSPQETLQQYVAEIQKNPDDNALREKIIKLAQEMKPSPKVPIEVDELVGKATYIFKNAKSEADFNDAVDAYQKALVLAPWVPEYYYNLGAVQEKAGKFKEAVGSLELYLLAAPDAKDAKEVREHIGGLKYAAEKATKESSPEAVVAKKEDAYAEWLKGLDGAKFIGPQYPDGRIGYEGKISFLVYHISGSDARVGWIRGVSASDDLRYAPVDDSQFSDGGMTRPIVNKQFKLPRPPFLNDQRPCTATISDDGQYISEQCPGSSVPTTYTRIK